MPVKSFTFAFKLDAKELLEFVVNHNIAVDIQASGSRRTEPAVLSNGHQLALPAPMNSIRTIQHYFASHPKEHISVKKVAEILHEAGYSPKSNYGLIFKLREMGAVKRVGKGLYQATAKVLA